MASFGDALRGLGSVLNPQVAAEAAEEDKQKQALARQLQMFALQQGALDKRSAAEMQARQAENLEARKSRESLARDAANRDLIKFEQTHALRVDSAQQIHDARLATAKTAEERAAETARHNKIIESLTVESNRIKEQLGGGSKPPSGYRWKQGQEGVLEPIPGGPATVLSPEQAAKTELLANGIKDVQRYRDLVFKDGKPDRGIIVGMSTPGMAGVPGTSSRLAYSYIYNAVEAKLRAESGAAVPESEVQRVAKRFVPSPLDNDETIKSKVDRLEEFLGGSLGRIKGQPGAGVNQPEATDVDALIKKYAK